MENLINCPTCGSPVKIVNGDEGTSYFEPVDKLTELIEWLRIQTNGFEKRNMCSISIYEKAEELLGRQ